MFKFECTRQEKTEWPCVYLSHPVVDGDRMGPWKTETYFTRDDKNQERKRSKAGTLGKLLGKGLLPKRWTGANTDVSGIIDKHFKNVSGMKDELAKIRIGDLMTKDALGNKLLKIAKEVAASMKTTKEKKETQTSLTKAFEAADAALEDARKKTPRLLRGRIPKQVVEDKKRKEILKVFTLLPPRMPLRF